MTQEAKTDAAQSIIERGAYDIARVEGVNIRSAADYFSTQRQFKGMAASVDKDCENDVVLGRKGRAARYSEEGSQPKSK